MKLKLIVAIDSENGIGKNNTIPWHLSKDFAWFKFITTHVIYPGKQNAILMGRKTWDSLPKKPLKNRINLVLSYAKGYTYEDAYNFCMANKVESLFIIGGASIYEYALSSLILDEIYITKIYHNYECDTFFPNLPDNYTKVFESGIISEGYSPDFQFFIFKSQ